MTQNKRSKGELTNRINLVELAFPQEKKMLEQIILLNVYMECSMIWARGLHYRNARKEKNRGIGSVVLQENAED